MSDAQHDHRQDPATTTHVVQIGRQRYVCGLFWQSLSRRHELQREGVELATKLNFDLMVLRIDRGVAAAGFASSSEGAQARLPSLGVIVSKSVAQQGAYYEGRQQPAPNWLGAFRMPDDRWVYFAVRDGVFLPSGDSVGTREAVLERLTSDYGMGGWNVVIGDPEIDKLGFPNFFPRRIEDMLWQRHGRTSTPNWARLRPVKPRVSPRAAALIALVVAGLTLGLIEFVSHHNQFLAAERARDFALERARLAMLAAHARGEEPHPWRMAATSPQFARSCIDAFALLAPGGWSLERYVCDRNRASYIWQRNGSTAAMLLTMVPRAQLDATGSHASYSQPLVTTGGPDDALLPTRQIDAQIMSRFQLLELAVTLTPVDPAAARDAGKASAWHEMRLHADFGGLSPVALADYLNEPGVRLDKLTYEAGKWSAEGIVYAK